MTHDFTNDGVQIVKPARPVLGGTGDPLVFRSVLGQYPTGVAVITGKHPNGPIGMAVNSFTSVSLDPPLALFCPAQSSSTWPALRECETLGISVLAHDQEWISRQFATKDMDRFDGIPWSSGPGGAPLLHGAVAWLEGVRYAEYEMGDHIGVVVEVTGLGSGVEPPRPLLFHQGKYSALNGPR